MVMTMVSKLSWPGGAKTTTAVFDDQLVISTAVCPILFAPVMSTVAKFWPEMVAEDLKAARRAALLKEHGLELPHALEDG